MRAVIKIITDHDWVDFLVFSLVGRTKPLGFVVFLNLADHPLFGDVDSKQWVPYEPLPDNGSTPLPELIEKWCFSTLHLFNCLLFFKSKERKY